MRHQASLIAAMEGMGRMAFRVARELASNSRSGLTTRFLSKKLDLPEEEVEYLVDVNHRLLFTDLTKVKIVPEGITAVKRITDGLENRGDVPSMFHLVKSFPAHDYRRLEELAGLEKPGPKKTTVETLLDRYYTHPDSIVEYVATQGFSDTAREVFDIVWQSKKGVMPVSRVRAVHGAADYEIEQAITELTRALALFEMFRFDAEERLVRMVGILSEIRQYREEEARIRKRDARVSAYKGSVGAVESLGLGFSDDVCRVVAAVAAKPVRLRGDGELFREDRRRLSEICPEDGDPGMATCLWVAQGVGWLARVDNELHAGELEGLIAESRLSRHRMLFEWLFGSAQELVSRRAITELVDELKADTWYGTVDFVRCAMRRVAEHEQPVLKSAGGHWHYVSPGATPNAERMLARSIQETLKWLGVVDCGEGEDGGVFRITPVGVWLLTGKGERQVAETYPERNTEIIVQPNFDIVAPSEDADPLLTVPLEQFAVRGSTGQATVYHVSKDSFTQALQDGHDGDGFVDFLVRYNRAGELPANVMTTLEDWRGGMKHVRVRTIHVLESDDSLVIADLLHRRSLKKYFSPIDPRKTVVYGKISKSELIKQLEKDGFIVK